MPKTPTRANVAFDTLPAGLIATMLSNRTPPAMSQVLIRAVDAECRRVDVLITDWAQWDDAYEFMRTRSRTFVNSNLSPNILGDLDLAAMIFVDLDGNMVDCTNDGIGGPGGEAVELEQGRRHVQIVGRRERVLAAARLTAVAVLLLLLRERAAGRRAHRVGHQAGQVVLPGLDEALSLERGAAVGDEVPGVGVEAPRPPAAARADDRRQRR